MWRYSFQGLHPARDQLQISFYFGFRFGPFL
ncbi:hypothetical protein EES45_28905 [Streptomyces sp. ADI97-07]|nr:hypothetical protein EES45_28905 [Streptomyces sp. ADI97-07]